MEVKLMGSYFMGFLLVMLIEAASALPSERQDSLQTLVRIENQRFSVSSLIQLPCVVQGVDSGVQINWFKDDQLIQSDDRISILGNLSLNVKNAQLSDSGWYTCKAVGASSVATSSVYITVTDAAESESCDYIRRLLNESIGVHLKEISNAFMLLPMMMTEFTERQKVDETTKKEVKENGCSNVHTCPPGPPGPPGLPGLPGPPGQRGVEGIPGLDGQPGQRGVGGIPGLDGQPGQRGVEGIPGLDGQPGLQGFPGVPGRPGTSCQVTEISEDSNSMCARGLPGPQGPKGDQGLTGFPGLRGLSGLPAIPGSPGEKGEKGMPGPPGPPAGVTGFSRR